ncbi:hypothetical protein Ga0102493_11668 [Erythrobacter litoralis]|nr:hypothetical protein [Erythrobacter litoralis]AOL24798.1 hypothetical protein Ga0102493_11668 [Erythrobacter litoralis]MEE4339811.1 hypothetical protein [Erythrobacter sp.]
MNHARNDTETKRAALVPLALASILALAACGPETEETAPLGESAEADIVGSEPVDDHEQGESPEAINDPTNEGPPLINQTGPDRDDGIDVEIE